jgi:hypothetical protein
VDQNAEFNRYWISDRKRYTNNNKDTIRNVEKKIAGADSRSVFGFGGNKWNK